MADQYDLIKINELKESGGPDDGNLLALGDEETGTLNKISYKNLTKKINSSIEENTNGISENKLAIEKNTNDIADINSDLTNLPEVQGGSIPQTTVQANGYTDVAVTFSKAFSKVPNVVVTLNVNTTTMDYSNVTVFTIRDMSTTGFTVRFLNNTSNERSPYAQWIAVAS